MIDGDRPTVAFLTTFYDGAVDGRFGRFHDWIHAVRSAEDPPFDAEVVALTATDHDDDLASDPHAILGDGDELWATALNKPESLLNVPRCARALRRLDYDVLHVLTLDTIAFPLAAAFGRDRLVVGPDVQGYFPGRLGDRWSASGAQGRRQRARFHLRRWLRRLAPVARAVALSEYHRSNVEKVGFDREAIEVLPPGVDPIFSPQATPEAGALDGPVEFLYVGDLSAYKGYPLFLEALAALETDEPWTARIVGSGEPDEELAAELGIADLVTHEGFVARADLPAYYRQADFFVMPSIDENGPNTIVEALSCGTPVLATDRPGINEYGDASCCRFFDRTTADIRATLQEALEERAALSDGALAYARSHSIEDTMDALAALYRDVARGE